jgi:hypothetical protein
MCEITTGTAVALSAISAATSIGTGIAGAVSGADAADAQYESQVKQAQAEQERLIRQQQYYDELGIHRLTTYTQQVLYRDQMQAFQNEQFNQLVASAQASTQDQYAAIHEQLGQRHDAAMDSIRQADREAEMAAGFVRSAAAETGTTGNSVRLAQQQHFVKAARVGEIEYANLDNAINQAERQMRGIQANMQSMLNQAIPQPLAPIPLPEPLPYVLTTVPMPEAPSMAPYYLQALGAVGSGLGQLGGAIAMGVEGGVFDSGTGTGYTSANQNANIYGSNAGYSSQSAW